MGPLFQVQVKLVFANDDNTKETTWRRFLASSGVSDFIYFIMCLIKFIHNMDYGLYTVLFV